jgi:NADPH2:quinone reductase
VIKKIGGPEVLQIVEEPLPEPRPGEVRVKILAAGVAYPDLLMREGIHPLEARHGPFTPGWDLVGVVDRLGKGVAGLEIGQTVAAMPVVGSYAEFICLPQEEFVPVPQGLDPAEAVSLPLNYVTAYQMMTRSARVPPRGRVLIHAAAGGVGTALLQLGQFASLEMYGTASKKKHSTVSDLGGIPIDYQHVDFLKEIRRLTEDGVDAVFDSVGGAHLWRSFMALRPGGKAIAYGTLGRGLAGGFRHRVEGIASIGWPLAVSRLVSRRRRILIYSIQKLKRRRLSWFREDLAVLLELLRQKRIQPLIAERIPLQEVRRSHELLASGSVMGKVVLLCG